MAEDTPQDPAPKADAPPEKPAEKVDPPEPVADDVDSLKAALAKANKDAERHRLRNKDLEPLAAKAKELEDARKSDTEKLTDRIGELEPVAAKALRFEVALDKGLTKSQAMRLVGTTVEELSADADQLIEDLGGAERTPAVHRRPTERLRPGSGDPAVTPEETDLKKLGERMFSR